MTATTVQKSSEIYELYKGFYFIEHIPGENYYIVKKTSSQILSYSWVDDSLVSLAYASAFTDADTNLVMISGTNRVFFSDR